MPNSHQYNPSHDPLEPGLNKVFESSDATGNMKFITTSVVVAALALGARAQTFFCSTNIEGWKAAGISDVADITAAANAAIAEVCAGNDPSLCSPSGSGLQLCQSQVPIGNCTGCRMFANYVFESATPPASCNVCRSGFRLRPLFF